MAPENAAPRRHRWHEEPGGWSCACGVICEHEAEPCGRHGECKIGEGSAMPDTPRGSAARWPWFCRGPRWFRVKGWGIRYVDHRRHPMLFGERNGYQRALHIGPHCFRWITP